MGGGVEMGIGMVHGLWGNLFLCQLVQIHVNFP